jgi:two-component system LytT family response regulator
MALTTIIVDDEHSSVENLQWKLEKYCPEVEVTHTFTLPVKALDHLKKQQPDLLFLDIEMPLLNGFDVLQQLGDAVTCKVIFITAFDQFGIQAVKFNALDYLLKPVQIKELQAAVQKCVKILSGNTVGDLTTPTLLEHQSKFGKIGLATKESIEFVNPGDIILCSSDSNYTMVYLANRRKKLISRTLKDFELTLQPFGFYRPHYSYLINIHHIQEFIRGDGGYLIMSNGMKVPVTKSRRPNLLKLLS